MSVGVAVSDASPLISLHQIDRLDLLLGLFDSIAVPPTIELEVAPSIEVLPAWVLRRYVPMPPGFLAYLDPGEREAIALAVHLRANFLVVDDLPGRRAAVHLGLQVIGTLGLLVRAKRSGLIGEVRPLVDAVIVQGLYVSDRLYLHILSIADERP